MHHRISIERFNRAIFAGDTRPQDALETALNEIDTHNIKSVIVVAIDENDDHTTYFAGPHVGSLKAVWTIFQYEIIRIVERMISQE